MVSPFHLKPIFTVAIPPASTLSPFDQGVIGMGLGSCQSLCDKFQHLLHDVLMCLFSYSIEGFSESAYALFLWLGSTSCRSVANKKRGHATDEFTKCIY